MNDCQSGGRGHEQKIFPRKLTAMIPACIFYSESIQFFERIHWAVYEVPFLMAIF